MAAHRSSYLRVQVENRKMNSWQCLSLDPRPGAKETDYDTLATVAIQSELVQSRPLCLG
jgi:hypothetical protein